MDSHGHQSKIIICLLVLFVPDLLPRVCGQSYIVLPDVQEEGLHLGPTEQPKEHASRPTAMDRDSGPIPSPVSAPTQWTGHSCRE